MSLETQKAQISREFSNIIQLVPFSVHRHWAASAQRQSWEKIKMTAEAARAQTTDMKMKG